MGLMKIPKLEKYEFLCFYPCGFMLEEAEGLGKTGRTQIHLKHHQRDAD